ncbi:MAG: hypothetical protein Q8886_02755 [Candidatus Phytoplasma australasiaticum]|nr:hypothetical protein [Candidatus Phytoplasma australasiaticum]
MSKKVKALKIELKVDLPNPSSMDKFNIIEMLIIVSNSDKIDAKISTIATTKGCGKDNRVKSS